MSTVKLGLTTLWSAFWTGFPIKLAIALVLLAGGLHPWEGTGLGFLLILSIPIDIWALGLCARTIFLERLHVDPPSGIGLTLWWQVAILSAVYLPILSMIEGGVVGGAKAAAAWLIDNLFMAVYPDLPIAERISMELAMWGGVAVVVLLILAVGWCFGIGWIVQRQLAYARPSDQPYPALVRKADLLRVPSDQPLLLTAFTGTGVALVFLFWGLIPVSTPHPHELYEMPEQADTGPVDPVEALKNAERQLAAAEQAVAKLEKEKGEEEKGTKTPAEGDGKPAPKTDKASATTEVKQHPEHGQPADASAAKAGATDQGHTHDGDDHQH